MITVNTQSWEKLRVGGRLQKDVIMSSCPKYVESMFSNVYAEKVLVTVDGIVK